MSLQSRAYRAEPSQGSPYCLENKVPGSLPRELGCSNRFQGRNLARFLEFSIGLANCPVRATQVTCIEGYREKHIAAWANVLETRGRRHCPTGKGHFLPHCKQVSTKTRQEANN